MAIFTVGLTGGVASGKTYVLGLFQALGVPLLEADEVAREVVMPGTPGLAAIAERFGAEMLFGDGSLNRRALREQIFADPDARRDLEAITHPLIRQRVADWRAAQTAPYCVYAAAILIEAGMTPMVDRVLVVDAPEDVQLRRLCARDRVAEPLARQMLAAQAPRARRLQVAHDVLDNRDETRLLEPALRRLHRLYETLGRHSANAAATI